MSDTLQWRNLSEGNDYFEVGLSLDAIPKPAVGHLFEMTNLSGLGGSISKHFGRFWVWHVYRVVGGEIVDESHGTEEDGGVAQQMVEQMITDLVKRLEEIENAD